MFCNKCGKELRDGAQFCTGCGAQLKVVPAHKAEEAEAPAEVVAAQAESAKPEPQPAALQGTGKKKKTGLWLLLTLILVAGVGCAVYFLFLREKPSKENPSDASSSQAISGPDTLNPGPQDMRPKVWAQNEDAEIAQLIDRYFQAKTEANAAELERILIPGSAVDSVSLSQDAQVYEWYRDIRVYSYPGMASMETGLFVTYYSKFKNIDTPLPTIAWFYTKPDQENNLKLMPLTDDSSPEYKYIYDTYVGSPVEKLAGEVSAANKKAIENDPNLKQYLAQLATKNYEPFVPETTTALSTTAPSSTAAPNPATAQTAQPTTAAPTMRATEAPTTEAPTTEEAVKTPALVNLRYEELEMGMIVTFGEYEQDNNRQNGPEPIEWIVFWKGDSNFYLISRNILDVVAFSDSMSNGTFAGSKLDKWIEGSYNSFLNRAFSNMERSMLANHDLESEQNAMYPNTKQDAEILYRRIGICSLLEMEEDVSEVYWRAQGTPYAISKGLLVSDGFSPYWTRSMGKNNSFAGVVNSLGELDYAGMKTTSNNVGVRPVLTFKNELFKASVASPSTILLSVIPSDMKAKRNTYENHSLCSLQ